MRLTWKDLIATVAVAGAVALYAAFLADADLPLVSGPRALAGLVLVFGMVACGAGGSSTLDADVHHAPGWARIFGFLGGVTLLAAVIALVSGSTIALAVLVAGTATLWLTATARRLFTRRAPIDDELHRLVQQQHQVPHR